MGFSFGVKGLWKAMATLIHRQDGVIGVDCANIVRNPVLDLSEVRMFVQVVRARSFVEAGRRLGVPPNTLSRRVRQLESRLDTRLMQRSTRKLSLTAAGSAFFERCAPAVDCVLSDARADLIDEGIDVAFRGGPVADQQLVFRRLMPQSFHLVASPAYVQSRGNPVTLQELVRHDCLISSGRL